MPQTSSQSSSFSEAERILERITDAFYALDGDWRFTYVNAQAERLLRRTRAELLGKVVWDEFPEAVDSQFYTGYQRAITEQIAVTIDDYYQPLETWFEVRAYPSPDGLSVYFRDVTSLKVAEAKRQQQTEEERNQFRLLADTSEEFIGMCDMEGVPFYVNPFGMRLVGLRDFDHVVSTNLRDYFFPEDHEFIFQEFLPKVQSDGHAETEIRCRHFESGEAVWLRYSVFTLSDSAGQPTGFGTISRDITDERQIRAERIRLADANRLLLESSRDGIYGIDSIGNFTSVNQAAARLLGYSTDEMIGRNAHTLVHHHYPDGTSYPKENCPIFQTLESARACHIEDDVFWRKDGSPFPVAYSASPLVVDGVVQGAVVTFSDISERKALQRVRETLFERERNIAEQLQLALQPDLPERVPGLAVTKYYEAAFTHEATVGGDFYDVFALDDHRSVLIVGDLSGKGLAAAAQVSTVRNMLRAYLYSMPSICDAVMRVNRVLVENNLISGFATLFVGEYDARTRKLEYVNCGQEPALVKRCAGNAIDMLEPTGPILGSFADSVWSKDSVILATGDVLAIFSDGLTEVGPSRRDMLGVEGVARLLDICCQYTHAPTLTTTAYRLALKLVEEVYKASHDGVMRDDVCLLVAIVE